MRKSGRRFFRLDRPRLVITLAISIGLVLIMATLAVAVHQPNHVVVGRGLYRVAVKSCIGPEDTEVGCNFTNSFLPNWEDVGVAPGDLGDGAGYTGDPIFAAIPITVPRSTGSQLVSVDFMMGGAGCDPMPGVTPFGHCAPLGWIVAIPESGPEIPFFGDFFGWTILSQNVDEEACGEPDICGRSGAYPMSASTILPPGSYTIVVRATMGPNGRFDPTPDPEWIFGITSWHMKVSQHLWQSLVVR